MKKCFSCKNILPYEMFYKQRKDSKYYASRCKPCKIKDTQEWQRLNPGRQETMRQLRIQRDPEKYAEQQKIKNQRRKDNGSIYDWYFQRKYKISYEQYNKMHKEQAGLCAICSKPENTKKLAVDHCHNTGRIRGLLCFRCNSALGKLQDSIELMQKAIIYLTGDNNVKDT